LIVPQESRQLFSIHQKQGQLVQQFNWCDIWFKYSIIQLLDYEFKIVVMEMKQFFEIQNHGHSKIEKFKNCIESNPTPWKQFWNSRTRIVFGLMTISWNNKRITTIKMSNDSWN
jgi:hypothetical protein